MEQYTLTELKYHIKSEWTKDSTGSAQNGIGAVEEMILKTARYLLSGTATRQEIERARNICLFRALLAENEVAIDYGDFVYLPPN